VFNDFLESLRKSSKYFVEDLQARTIQKNELILILFLISIGTLTVTMAILCPVVSTVNLARLKVLSLFVDIPNHHVIALSNKCERFLSSFHDSEHSEEADTNETDSLKVDDTDVSGGGGGGSGNSSKRNSHKQPKNSQGSNKKVFIQFGIGVLCIMAYFVVMFVLSLRYI
jgi:flagellar basal body-associated protein FliL